MHDVDFDIDDIKLQSDVDSEEETHLPSATSQNAYDFLKFTGIIIYQISFAAVIGQVKQAKFASKYLLDMFKGFLLMRPIVIVCFTTFTMVLSWHRAKYTLAKLKVQKKIEIE